MHSEYNYLYRNPLANVALMLTLLFVARIMAANAGSMRILIKGGKVVNDDFTQEADVYIENGVIQQVNTLHTCTHSVSQSDPPR